MTDLKQKKARLVTLRDECRKLAEDGRDLQTAYDYARKAYNAAENIYKDEAKIFRLDLRLDGILASLDETSIKLSEYVKDLDGRYCQAERDVLTLEGEPEVLCRCHGEVECEDQDAGKPAPQATVAIDSVYEYEVASRKYKRLRYKAVLTFGEESVSVEGTSGQITALAEQFWVRRGFDAHGAYRHVVSLYGRLEQEAEEVIAP